MSTTKDETLNLNLANRGEEPPTKGTSTTNAQSDGVKNFRAWLNKKIEQRGATVTIKDDHCLVTELTPDYQLRVKFGDGFSLIPFDSETISTVIDQVQR